MDLEGKFKGVSKGKSVSMRKGNGRRKGAGRLMYALGLGTVLSFSLCAGLKTLKTNFKSSSIDTHWANEEGLICVSHGGANP